MNGKSVLGIIFANIHEEALDTLTAQRTMGSVPFCSRYRLIDFPLFPTWWRAALPRSA